MTLRSEQGRIVLEGRCRIEDAETLLSALQLSPDSVVEIDAAETLHTAVLQVLMAAKPIITGISRHEFLARHGVLVASGERSVPSKAK